MDPDFPEFGEPLLEREPDFADIGVSLRDLDFLDDDATGEPLRSDLEPPDFTDIGDPLPDLDPPDFRVDTGDSLGDLDFPDLTEGLFDRDLLLLRAAGDEALELLAE